MENYLSMMMCICSIFLRMIDTDEAEDKREAIWEYLKAHNPDATVPSGAARSTWARTCLPRSVAASASPAIVWLRRSSSSTSVHAEREARRSACVLRRAVVAESLVFKGKPRLSGDNVFRGGAAPRTMRG